MEIDINECKLVQLLLPCRDAASVVDEWVERGYECDLRVRRAKTKGHIVLETRNPCFALTVQRLYGCKVYIKD